jgi:hypothetical protein
VRLDCIRPRTLDQLLQAPNRADARQVNLVEGNPDAASHLQLGHQAHDRETVKQSCRDQVNVRRRGFYEQRAAEYVRELSGYGDTFFSQRLRLQR